MFKVEMWNIENVTGYHPITTLYEDFGIAERFGEKSIRDTLKTMLKFYDENDYKELTELVMVLNWKLWSHYERVNMGLAKLYDELWRKADDYVRGFLKGEKLSYYYRTTD